MKFLRFLDGKEEKKGILDGDIVRRIHGSFFDSYTVTNETVAVDEVHFLPPILPSKIVCAGRNYAKHAEEFGDDVPSSPIIFLKAVSALNHHKGICLKPKEVTRLDFEGELAVVIGKKCRKVPLDAAKNYILGYTILNDISARNIFFEENFFTRSKGYDTFAPIGPYINTDYDCKDRYIQTLLNGELKQDDNTKNMVFSVEYLISFISNIMTLMPGDIISTGTPEGVGPMNDGDRVDVIIDGLGTLTTFIENDN